MNWTQLREIMKQTRRQRLDNFLLICCLIMILSIQTVQGSCGQDLNGNQLYFVNITNECVTSCPTGYWKLSTENQCITFDLCKSKGRFVNNITGVCEQTCTNGLFGQFFYGGLCVEACGQQLYLLKSMNFCVWSCRSYANQSSTPNTIFGDSFSKTCVSENECSFNTYDKIQSYSYPVTHICVDVCPDNLYAHPETKKCERKCFGKYPYRNTLLKMCAITVNETIANYLQTSATTVSDQNMVVISKTAAILIFFGLIFSFLLVIGGVLFYKYYLKKKLYHQCKQMTARKNMDQSS